ncbi:hypothetical protein AMS68_000318 [Peltaster fructicola]|uniref:Methyltransferase domain-containing protein n=1 Tax=Peltaster fructicola TaxID=286661 RepID=A0A6H0XJI3_9PEZI|nr:hypothetical protein AMS68_000318 [Peltaster fructicola]
MLGLRSRAHRHVAVTIARGLRTRPNQTSSTIPLSAQPQQKPTSSKPRATNNIKGDADLKRRKEWHRKFGMYGAFAVALVMGAYCSRLAITIYSAGNEDAAKDVSQQKDVAERYNEIADNFDGDVNFSEWSMGILKHRKNIAKMCTGNVLEVSCGTGRNLGYYQLDDKDRAIKSLTFIDLSPQMVQVCKRKFLALRATRRAPKADPMEVRFVAGSALDEMPLAPDGKKYDTIVQTMGLCSTASPVELVVNMARHLDLSNPDARIILLEHGRSHYSWLNKVMDSSAQKHAENYGCWYNRELNELVSEAALQTGLEIVGTKRFDLGTTYLYELRPGPHAVAKLETIPAAPADGAHLNHRA